MSEIYSQIAFLVKIYETMSMTGGKKMYGDFEVLAVIGKLEVKFENNERVLNELLKLQRFISENNFINLAISFGRLCEILNISEIKENKEIQAIYDFIFDENTLMEMYKGDILDLTITELGMNKKVSNYLWRSGIETVRNLILLTEGELRAITGIGDKTFKELVSKLNEHGLALSH